MSTWNSIRSTPATKSSVEISWTVRPPSAPTLLTEPCAVPTTWPPSRNVHVTIAPSTAPPLVGVIRALPPTSVAVAGVLAVGLEPLVLLGVVGLDVVWLRSLWRRHLEPEIALRSLAVTASVAAFVDVRLRCDVVEGDRRCSGEHQQRHGAS